MTKIRHDNKRSNQRVQAHVAHQRVEWIGSAADLDFDRSVSFPEADEGPVRCDDVRHPLVVQHIQHLLTRWQRTVHTDELVSVGKDPKT